MFRMNGMPRAQGGAGAASFRLAQCYGCRARAHRDVLVASPEERYLATSAPMQVARLHLLTPIVAEESGLSLVGTVQAVSTLQELCPFLGVSATHGDMRILSENPGSQTVIPWRE